MNPLFDNTPKFDRLPFAAQSSEQEAPPPGDTEWLIRQTLLTNPKQGCELLFRQYFAPLCSHAVRFVYNRQVAEDLVMDVLLAVYTNELYRTITGSYRAYLYQAVRNRAANYIRWEMGRQETLPESYEHSDTETSRPDQLLQQDELYRTLEEAVGQLPPQQQRVFLLSRFEGKSYKEIASELNLSPKTVENHLLRALSTIRQVLRTQHLIGWLIVLSAGIGRSIG